MAETTDRVRRYDEQRAMSEGWLLANTGKRREIQRYDADQKKRFATDGDALAWVIAAAKNSHDDHAMFCLARAGITA